MKALSIFILLMSILISGCRHKSDSNFKYPTRIIFDTDMGPDYDDVGALAVLHAMADSGYTDILATVASNKQELVAPCIEIINSYFGRPELPIGAPKAPGASMTAYQHWPDSLILKYPHKIRSTDDVPDAVDVYREILASQPDNSVTIVTVGFLTNIANLLKSDPDSYSSLNGTALVSKKVKLLVSMAGRFPEGREFNVYMDSASSVFVLEKWPGEIIFTGFEIGREILTGLRLFASDLNEGPVKDVFRISIPYSDRDRNGRMSWDETAVLIGVYGTEEFFDTVKGSIIVGADGSNKWKNDPEGKHRYVVQKMQVPQITRFIEDRMMHIPMKAPSSLLDKL